MIAFDSPEGQALRDLNPSRNALIALCFSALNDGSDSWAQWSWDRLGELTQDAETIALRFLRAINDSDERLARQLWAVLASYPIDGTLSTVIQAARNLRSQIKL